MIVVKTHGAVLFDNEPLSAGVTQLHERHILQCNWATPAESGSLSNTTTKYVLILIMHAESNCVSYVLFDG